MLGIYVRLSKEDSDSNSINNQLLQFNKKTIMKTLLLSIILLSAVNSYSQDVTIPDSNFKNYLVNSTSINTNGDSEIQVTEANAYTGLINCSGLGISDLTGIEAFTAN